MSSSKGSISLQIQRDLAYFPIELSLNQDDSQSSIIFAPALPNAQDYPPPPEQVKLAWQLYGKRNNILGIQEDLTYTEQLKYVNPQCSMLLLTLENDNNAGTVHQTEKLEIVKFGKATFRVYGPRRGLFWKDSTCEETSSSLFVEEDLFNKEKLMMLSTESENQRTIDLLYYDTRNPEKKMGGLASSLFDIDRLTADRGGFVMLRYIIHFMDQYFERDILIPANRADAQVKERQVRKIGRKTETRREMIRFDGTISERIKYWYDKPERDWNEQKDIRILEWTQFVDEKGNNLQDPNSMISNTNYYPSNINPRTKKYGTTFYAPCPCWGSILVEYDVDYTEYESFYDVLNAKREFEISAGQISKVGFSTYSRKGELLEYSAYNKVILDLEDFDDAIDENSSHLLLVQFSDEQLTRLISEKRLVFAGGSPDKIQISFADESGGGSEEERQPTLQTMEENPIVYILRDADIDKCVVIYKNLTFKQLAYDELADTLQIADIFALKLFNTLKFKPFDFKSFIAIATNGRRTVSYDFKPPVPNFMDFEEADMPRHVLYQKNIRQRIFPDINNLTLFTDIDYTEELTFIDPLGKITSENLAQYRKENEKRVSDLEQELSDMKSGFSAQKRAEEQERLKVEQELAKKL